MIVIKKQGFLLKIWGFLSLFFLFSAQVFAANKSLGLTVEEQVWLDKHPVIKVGVDQNWPPFDYVNVKNEHQGIASDYLKHLSTILNIHFEISADIWGNVLKGVKSQQLDMLACASDTKERRQYLDFTKPYIEIDTVFVTRTNYVAINSLNDLFGKTVALPKGTYIHELLKNQPQEILFQFVKSNQEALQAVSLGNADAYVGNLAVVSYFIEKDLLTNLKIDNRLQTEKSKLAFAIRKKLPILSSILQKGLDTIPQSKHQEIIRKWINFNQGRKKLSSLHLTSKEKSWLKAHQNIRIGIDPAWPPIEYVDSQQKTYQGIASEYVNYLEKALVINMHFGLGLSWKEVVEKTKMGEIDVLPAISKTLAREKYLNFTRPYLKFPYVLFTRDDTELITSIDELIDKKIVVEKNYANHDILNANYPEIELILVDNTEQALSALSLGKADAYMGNLAATSHIILQTGMTNIKVAAPTDYSNDLAFAVRKDWPELIPILQKVLDSLTVQEKNRFKKKWFSIRYEHDIDSTLIWKVIAIALLIFFLFSLWLWQMRKQKEIIRLSEERFQLAMEASKEGLWDWNLKTNEVYFSPGYAEMLGYEKNELEADYLTWESLLHPEDKKLALRFLRKIIHNCSQQYEHEFRLRHKQGHYLHIRSIGSVVSIEKGKATRALGTQQNITEQKNIKTALEQQKFALDSSAIVAMTNKKGIITYANDRFCIVSGYSQEELIGQDHRLLNSGVHPASLWKDMYIQASKGIPWRQEICNRAKDGSLYWVDSTIIGLFTTQGKLDQYIAIRTEITQRKIAEQKLKRSEQQFSSLIHNIPSTFYQYKYIDNSGWSISFITDAIESISGYPASLFVSKQMALADITHSEDIHLIGQTVHKAIKTGQAYSVEYRIIHKDQSIRWLHDKGISIYENNKPLFLQGAIFDITVNKQAELELAEAKQAAELANSFKSDFLSNMSHEIRTPMNAIVGLGYLALKTELSSQQQDYIKKIQNASQSLLTIINDILDFSKIEAGKLFLESVDFKLETIFETLGDLFRFTCEEKNLEFIFEIHPKTPADIVGDPTRLSQILVNLCSNAIKFTEQGEIKISVSPIDISANKVILKFSVTDTGCGISDDSQQHLFESFFQTDTSTTRTHGGTGLGLAISKQLVEMMNGSIGVNSTKGKGSTFFFFIECGLDSLKKNQILLTPPDLRGLNVLVVDDNTSARNVLHDQLTSLSFKVTMVASAIEAYAVLQSTEKVFDLILMDWSMPGINGLEAVKHIKFDLRLEKIPAIIMVTAYARDEVIKEAEKNTLSGFIVKPTTPSTLFECIMQALRPTYLPKLLNNDEKQALLSGLVLLVEDNKINQQVAEELLKSFGLQVTIADNGLDAVNKVFQQGQAGICIDVVLMDIQMPEMDGLEATYKIRCNPEFKDLPIIAMTAHAMVGDRAKSLAAGMNEHVTKPIDPAELHKVLTQWLPQPNSMDIISAPISMPKGVILLPDYSENLDIEWGLKRIGGNRGLFSKLLKDFYYDHHNDIERLQQAFNEQQLETARRIIHTVKGVSGNIGAGRLNKKAVLLEQSINSTNNFSESLGLFTQSFSALMTELNQFVNQKLVTKQAQLEVSHEQLTIHLNELHQLLNMGDIEALELLEKIQSYLNIKSADKVKKLSLAIEGYDFDLAITLLENLSLQFGIALS